MNRSCRFVLDSDVFIAAKNSYYAFTICPGYWDSLIHHHSESHICSIDRVRAELLAGRKTEDLVTWVRERLPVSFFRSTGDTAVLHAYADIMLWLQRNSQYFDQAKAKFATEADGWLVAYAMVHELTVVTNEQPRPQSRSRILLPDVCEHFDVTYSDTFLMLNELAVQYHWKPV